MIESAPSAKESITPSSMVLLQEAVALLSSLVLLMLLFQPLQWITLVAAN